jgi:hypothetical protein
VQRILIQFTESLIVQKISFFIVKATDSLKNVILSVIVLDAKNFYDDYGKRIVDKLFITIFKKHQEKISSHAQ